MAFNFVLAKMKIYFSKLNFRTQLIIDELGLFGGVLDLRARLFNIFKRLLLLLLPLCSRFSIVAIERSGDGGTVVHVRIFVFVPSTVVVVAAAKNYKYFVFLCLKSKRTHTLAHRWGKDIIMALIVFPIKFMFVYLSSCSLSMAHSRSRSPHTKSITCHFLSFVFTHLPFRHGLNVRESVL